MKAPLFHDRTDAGRRLARLMATVGYRPDTVVLALPRGGVPVALEIARQLQLALDVFLVRRLAVPGHESLSMGVIAEGGVRNLDHDVIRSMRLGTHTIDGIESRERSALAKQARLYRGDREAPTLKHRTVILVTDGLAAAFPMQAAIQAVRESGPARIVVAVPIMTAEAKAELERSVDAVFCLATPEPFQSVGLWYQDFEPVVDLVVRQLLETGRKALATATHAADDARKALAAKEEEVLV